jgi:chaperonin cofactor prefoldin
MFQKPPMPTREELAAMSKVDLEARLKEARAALQEAKQLAQDATEQEKVFSVYEAEQKRRSKSALKRESEAGER